MSSTFEFWLELAWLGAKFKGKTLLVIEFFFTLHRYCSVFKAKHDPSFLSAFQNSPKIQISLKLAVLRSESMKRNCRGLIFSYQSGKYQVMNISYKFWNKVLHNVIKQTPLEAHLRKLWHNNVCNKTSQTEFFHIANFLVNFQSSKKRLTDTSLRNRNKKICLK